MLSSRITSPFSRRVVSSLLATRRLIVPGLWYGGATRLSSSSAPIMKAGHPDPDMRCRSTEQQQQQSPTVADASSTTSVTSPYMQNDSKTTTAAALRNTLLYAIELVSGWCVAARFGGVPLEDLELANAWTLQAAAACAALSSSAQQFSNAKIADIIKEGMLIERELAIQIASCSGPLREGVAPTESCNDLTGMSTKELEAFGAALSLRTLRMAADHEDTVLLNEVAKDGLIGVCAYAADYYQHAQNNDSIMASIHDIFHKLEEEPEAKCLDKLLARVGALFEKVVYNHVDAKEHSMYPEVLESVKGGNVSHVFLFGGNGDALLVHNYFKELSDSTPTDSLIVTMGSATDGLRRSQELVDSKLVDGYPRLIDFGQSRNVNGGIVMATELAKKLGCDVNELPLSVVWVHADQQDISALLALLSMGFKNICLGPSRPDYAASRSLLALATKYKLIQASDPKQDVEAMMRGIH